MSHFLPKLSLFYFDIKNMEIIFLEIKCRGLLDSSEFNLCSVLPQLVSSSCYEKLSFTAWIFVDTWV